MGLIIESFYLSLFSNSLSTSCEDIRATLDKYEPLFLYFSKRLENVDELPLTIKNTPEEAFIETYQECQKICELQYFDKIFRRHNEIKLKSQKPKYRTHPYFLF